MARSRRLYLTVAVLAVMVIMVCLKTFSQSPKGKSKEFDFRAGLTNEQARRIDVISHVVNTLPRGRSGYVQQTSEKCCSMRDWTRLQTKEEGRREETPSRQQPPSSSVPYDLMDRDITWSEEWPGVEVNTTNSYQYPTAVHYVWCGAGRQLTFAHYLGLLSALRVLKPLKFFFHYTHSQPATDYLMYNSWFQEFKRFVPVLDMHHLQAPPVRCGSQSMLNLVLALLVRHGGLYLGEKVVLTGLPQDLLHLQSWSAFPDSKGVEEDWTRGVVYLRQPGTPHPAVSGLHRRSVCVSVDDFNTHGHGEERKCVIIRNQPKYPRDIWSADTSFGEVARWLFYGRREAFHVQRDPAHPIPRISHYIRVQSSQKPMYQEEFSFNHFISVLSALHVGGFREVYLHVDEVPTGRWWRLLQSESIRVLRLQKPELVYQQRVTGITHFSDVSRYNVLYRYGGVYQDFDCVWTTRVPDHILEYPVVVSPAISKNGLWPDGLAIGMLMARPGAPFLRHAFKGYRQYRGNNYLYNAIMRSYRTYEQYPGSLLFDPHFTVFCINKRCVPTWLRDGSYWDLEKDGGRGYNWSSEALALHMPIPKPVPSFASPRALRDSRDLFGDLGRMVLRASGRLHVLEEE